MRVCSPELYQIPKRLTLFPIFQGGCDLIQRCRGEFDMAAPISLREDFDGPLLRAPFPQKRESSRGGFWLSLRFTMAARGLTRPGWEGSVFRPFAIGCFGSTPRGRTGSSMANRPDVLACSMTHKGARSSPWSKPVRPLRFMRSFAGD